jgi:hypothetical protein
MPAEEEASPVAMEDMASPAASPVAEDAPEAPTGEVVTDEAVIEEATTAVANVFACLTEGDYFGASALLTENYRLTMFGSANLYTVATILAEISVGMPLELYGFGDVLDLGDGRLAVQYDQLSGQQVERFLVVLVEEDGFWKFDEEFEQAPETNLNSVSVGLQAATDESEYAFEISPPEVPQAPATLFRFFNVGEMEHEAIILKTPDGFDPASLVETPPESPADLPTGVEFIGFGYAPPGEEETLLFLDLEVGTYTIYCFIPAPDGETHAAKGMITQFTVTEAAAPEVPDVVGSPEATPDD